MKQTWQARYLTMRCRPGLQVQHYNEGEGGTAGIKGAASGQR